MPDSRWTTRSSRSIVKDRWIDLRADDCVTPSGVTIAPYYVLTYADWVNVIALTPEDHLVLTRQYRHGAGRMFTELPGGAIDRDDIDGEVAARRELLEETGYASDRWQAVSSLYPNPASQTNRLHIYLALDATKVAEPKLDAGEEGLSVFTMPVTDVVAGLRDGLLGQSLHVASLMLALQLAGRLG